MKKFTIVIGLLLVALLQLQGQVSKFSYQAVLRNADGTVITNQTVDIKISLRKTSASGGIVYSEVHTVPITNGQGIVSLTIGGGTVQSGSFATIPWGDDIFIQVEVMKAGGTYQNMGTTQILSVPYAIQAISAKGATSSNPTEDAIFEVKNKDGKVVFGVYQGGVRIYVDPATTAKGAKGGFAVGGLTNQGKTTIPDMLFVSPDSTRIKFDETSAKGAKGGFAVGGLTNQGKSGTNKDFFRVTTDSTYFSTTILASADIITTGNVNTGAGTVSSPIVFDGDTYKTVQIGNQIWMKENLKSTHYSNGTLINPVDVFVYKNTANPDTLNTYGRLYSAIAIDSSFAQLRVCPVDWHIPTQLDWEKLMGFVGGPYWQTNAIITGLKLMETGTPPISAWNQPNNANNASGFSGRPGGFYDGGNTTFFDMGYIGNWWVKYGSHVTLDNTGAVSIQGPTPSTAYSVRCIKDKVTK